MKKVSWILSFLIIGLTAISVVNNRQSNADFLEDQLLEIEQLFTQSTAKDRAVSQADVAWHLDHMLKVINQISGKLATSDPKAYESSFNIQRIVVHSTGIIPRSVAQSPENVRPPQVVHLDSLKLQLLEAKQCLAKIPLFEEKAFTAHPVFGNLDRDQSRRFLEVHTNHHLKIIRDILGE